MISLLNAARYLAKDFSPIYNDDPMFDEPIVPAAQRDTFDAIHILLCAATGADRTLISAKRVTEWLGQKAQAANV